ncbi:MAG: sulfur oxidation c-type cytochrome SoxX [Acidobacteria bacterium RIFCSPLOWO2_02_FULL_65_29]|nr:MAG: sulfur oxidation c-type cytochrome SoxX [Acidobacteria bacterium RIFCSPLOWO2_02_FULL_65_29]
MMSRWTLGAGLAALVLSPVAVAEPSDREVQRIMKRDFHPKGQAKMDRLEQDAVQRVCTATNGKPPEMLAKALEADQYKSIPFPQGSLIGNWKNGAKIAWGGRGMQWHEDPKKPSDGGCYNCHEASPLRPSAGTIGPSLKAFGKARGSSPEMQKYVYGKIYNAKAYNLCSEMPRFGHTGSLTDAQIRDLVAYLLDPASPVNQ